MSAPDLRDPSLPAATVCAALGLLDHPEGGHFREIWRSPVDAGPVNAEPGAARPAMSTIHFLLAAGERSHWHRVDADELWVWQGGAPARLELAPPVGPVQVVRLGPDLAVGECLQVVVPRDVWQAARSDGAWTLFACIVAPAFSFEGFELAPPEWQPAGGVAPRG